MLKEWLAVALGGMIGTVARHGLNTLAKSWNPLYSPWATLLVNVVGCLAIGWLYRWAMERNLTGHWLEIGARVGVLGGLTTFSSYALEVTHAWNVKPWLAVAILLGHIALGLTALVIGMQLATQAPST